MLAGQHPAFGATAARPRSPVTTTSATLEAQPGPAVLVVEDDPDLLNLLGIALRRSGMRVVQTSSGEAALEALKVEQIGCVVSDLGLKDMNGIDLVRALRARAETSTLPFLLMTGSGDSDSVIEALNAGADDFLAKPVRLDELVARVRAHLRTQAAWTEVVSAELRTRADAIQAIGQLTLSDVPERAAEAAVMELARRIGSAFVGVYRLAAEHRLEPLATWNATDGLVLGGVPLRPARSRDLIRRAREGPFAERLTGPEPGDQGDVFWTAKPNIAAVAPIYAGEDLVGTLTIAVVIDSPTIPVPVLQARLLASAIDYASVLGVVAGPAIADRRQSATEKAALRRVLSGRAFFSVFQPIVSLRTGQPVGYEALTRFTDGTAPEELFSRAAAAGLGFDFELAAIETAIASAPAINEEGYLSVNVSADLVVTSGRRLRRVLGRWPGRIVLEVTEHAPVQDYEAFRRALGRLGNVELSIDDAGAGYASLRHILELGPAWVKLDMTLVRGIDADPLRQALVAGLAYFARRSGQRLIAEGVERQEEADALVEIGVEFAQGFLFGRPERGRA
jgi:EAL domain-containing protein (putative c-di-GMP-specific phosphodiesterase class I)/DNA-binding response OmpR family regulator